MIGKLKSWKLLVFGGEVCEGVGGGSSRWWWKVFVWEVIEIGQRTGDALALYLQTRL